MSLLQMSFSGGVLILVILALRAVTIHRLPKTTFLTLWWVALLRLLIPLSIPSVFSAYSWLTTFFHTADNLVESPVMNFLPPAAMPPVQAGTALPQVLPEPEPLSVWFVLWCAGATVCAIFYLASYFRCRYEFQTALPVKKDVVDRWLADHPLRRTIRVRQSDRIASPLTYGLFRPVILLPKKTDWEDEAHLSYILLHEFIHIRRCDVAAKLLLLLALCLHWFNPLVWVLAALFNRDLELACDEQVLRASAGDTRSDYATLLIHMEECRGGYAPPVQPLQPKRHGRKGDCDHEDKKTLSPCHSGRRGSHRPGGHPLRHFPQGKRPRPRRSGRLFHPGRRPSRPGDGAGQGLHRPAV